MQHYDIGIVGASPIHIMLARRNAVASMRKAGHRPCTTSMIHWKIGSESGPLVANVTSLVNQWIRIWRRSLQEPDNGTFTRQAWHKTYARVATTPLLVEGPLLPHSRRRYIRMPCQINWGLANEPMHSTIGWLAYFAWITEQPDHWLLPREFDRIAPRDDRDEHGEYYHRPGDPNSIAQCTIAADAASDYQIVQAEQNRVVRFTWLSAASHFIGGRTGERHS